MANGLAAVLAQCSLGFRSKMEVLHELPQGVLGELPGLKEMRLAESAELTGELRIHFETQCGRCHTARTLFVTERDKPGAYLGRALPLQQAEVYSVDSEGLVIFTTRNFLGWMAAALTIFIFWSVSSRIQKNERQLSFSDFMAQLEREHVANVTITGSNAGSRIDGEFKNGQKFRTFAPPQVGNLVNRMLEKGVEVNARDANSSSWLGHIISWTPIVIMIAFLIFVMRQMQGRTDIGTRERIWEVLSESKEDMSEAQISSRLSHVSRKELQGALYQMLREGTIVFTTERNYRAKTVE